MDNLEVGAVVSVPNTGRLLASQLMRTICKVNLLDGQEHDSVEKASTKNGAVLESVPGEEGNRGAVDLPENESGKEEDTKNDHSNDVPGSPSLGGDRGNGEGEEKESPASGGEKETESYKVFISLKLGMGKRRGGNSLGWRHHIHSPSNSIA